MNLKYGEVICDKCNGSGLDNDAFDSEQKDYTWFCTKCDGDGKFDWIEAVVGKHKDSEGINLRYGMNLGHLGEHPLASVSMRGDIYKNIKDKEMYVYSGWRWKKINETRCYYN